MAPEYQSFLDYLKASGVDPILAEDFRTLDPVERRARPSGENEVRHDHVVGSIVEERDLASGLHADHATLDVARLLGPDLLPPLTSGLRVLDVGCGSGVLALIAARAGAEVVATDVCSDSLALAGRNAERNGVQLDLRPGHLLEPVRDESPFDLILANLPHKPGDQSEGLPLGQAGGPEGDLLWAEAQDDFEALTHKGSVLHFFLHSLPHPRLLLRLEGAFDLRLRSLKLRRLGEDEYGSALRQRFRSRAEEGKSFLWRDEEGEALVAAAWTGVRR